jgi:hypothetical protein
VHFVDFFHSRVRRCRSTLVTLLEGNIGFSESCRHLIQYIMCCLSSERKEMLIDLYQFRSLFFTRLSTFSIHWNLSEAIHCSE